jgi:hypothetical protein
VRQASAHCIGQGEPGGAADTAIFCRWYPQILREIIRGHGSAAHFVESIRLLADHLGVPRSELTLLSGATYRVKRFRIDGPV